MAYEVDTKSRIGALAAYVGVLGTAFFLGYLVNIGVIPTTLW
jgi:hypothetical protein